MPYSKRTSRFWTHVGHSYVLFSVYETFAENFQQPATNTNTGNLPQMFEVSNPIKSFPQMCVSSYYFRFTLTVNRITDRLQEFQHVGPNCFPFTKPCSCWQKNHKMFVETSAYIFLKDFARYVEYETSMYFSTSW